MQIFPCPYCGPRSENEFLFISEADNLRPEPAAEVSAGAWSAYLHNEKNGKGDVAEIWQHLTCGELFQMARNSQTMEVSDHKSLRGGTSE